MTQDQTSERVGQVFPVRGLILSTAIFSAFSNLLMLTGPLFMLQVYDRVLGSRSEETLVALFGLVVLLFSLYGLLEFARTRVLARVGARLQARLERPAFMAVLDRAALRTGEARGTLSDIEAIRALYASPIILALFDLPWTPLFLFAIFVFHPLLGWLAVAGGVVLVVVTLLNQAATARKTADSARLSSRAHRFSSVAEAGAELIRAQGMRQPMATRWLEMQRTATNRSLQASDWTGSFSALTKAFRLFLQSAMLALGAWLVLQGKLTAGAMVATSIMLGRALSPIEIAVAQWPQLQRARDARRDLKALLANARLDPPATELPEPPARLEARNLGLILRRGDSPVLQGVSFSLNPGEALGVIGKSGSGKTTLARIIVGLVAPSAGEVRLGGATLDQYGPDRLGRHIGYLPQDLHFFEGTVAENIAQMDPSPDAERIVNAARRAHVHDIVLRLPEGYDTRIGAADAQLSGGQRQRLALARALYNDPVLLVLDEPNSALDAEGSEALNAVVAAMKAAGKGVIIMTHRPTAISTCDRLLVLDGGRVAGYGQRDEIIRAMIKNAGDVQRVVARGAGE